LLQIDEELNYEPTIEVNGQLRSRGSEINPTRAGGLAEWCGPCKMLVRVDEIARSNLLV
jgi:hypothetical protein